MVVLKLMLVAAMTAAAPIPLPYVLLEIIGYGSPNLPTRNGPHCHHRLRPLDTLLLALATSNQQSVDLAAVESIIVPVEATLKLPEIPIGGRKHTDRLTLLTSPVCRPLLLRPPLLEPILLLADLNCDATKRRTGQGHILCSSKHVQPSDAV